jgi:hypothetical protein
MRCRQRCTTSYCYVEVSGYVGRPWLSMMEGAEWLSTNRSLNPSFPINVTRQLPATCNKSAVMNKIYVWLTFVKAEFLCVAHWRSQCHSSPSSATGLKHRSGAIVLFLLLLIVHNLSKRSIWKHGRALKPHTWKRLYIATGGFIWNNPMHRVSCEAGRNHCAATNRALKQNTAIRGCIGTRADILSDGLSFGFSKYEFFHEMPKWLFLEWTTRHLRTQPTADVP